MDDSDLNPMKTRLMFVAPGLVLYPDWPGESQNLGRATGLARDFEAAAVRAAQEATLGSEPPRRQALRRLLERLRHAVERHRPLPT